MIVDVRLKINIKKIPAKSKYNSIFLIQSGFFIDTKKSPYIIAVIKTLTYMGFYGRSIPEIKSVNLMRTADKWFGYF